MLYLSVYCGFDPILVLEGLILIITYSIAVDKKYLEDSFTAFYLTFFIFVLSIVFMWLSSL